MMCDTGTWTTIYNLLQYSQHFFSLVGMHRVVNGSNVACRQFHGLFQCQKGSACSWIKQIIQLSICVVAPGRSIFGSTSHALFLLCTTTCTTFATLSSQLFGYFIFPQRTGQFFGQLLSRPGLDSIHHRRGPLLQRYTAFYNAATGTSMNSSCGRALRPLVIPSCPSSVLSGVLFFLRRPQCILLPTKFFGTGHWTWHGHVHLLFLCSSPATLGVGKRKDVFHFVHKLTYGSRSPWTSIVATSFVFVDPPFAAGRCLVFGSSRNVRFGFHHFVNERGTQRSRKGAYISIGSGIDHFVRGGYVVIGRGGCF